MPPLISAVMITGKDPQRIPLARIAIRCFLQQSYPRKELVIVNHGTSRLLNRGIRGCREYKVQKASLGALRNLALDCCEGDLVTCWDDDDWHHPERMSEQYVSIQQLNCNAVVLRRQIRMELGSLKSAHVSAPREGHPGTILHWRGPYMYPEIERSEDTLFIRHNFPDCEVAENEAHLYVRNFHGCNVWSRSHILERMDGREALTNVDHGVLCRVVREYKQNRNV